MRTKDKPTTIPKPIREHCPDCAMYLDDIIEHQEEISKGDISMGKFDYKRLDIEKKFPGVIMSPYPGTQFRRYTTGSIYDILGFYTPCHCESGNLVVKGYYVDGRFHNNKKRMDETYHRYPEHGTVKIIAKKYTPMEMDALQEKMAWTNK